MQELPSLSTSLLHRIQEMQPQAWARLVEVFSPIIYRWARSSGLSGSDSADLVQDVFIALANNVHRFERQKAEGSFRSWLATITRNRVRDFFRRRQRHPEAMGGTQGLQKLENLPADVESEAFQQHLENSISLQQMDDRIPVQVLQLIREDCDPQTWTAFWETTVQGKAAADVAQTLGLNVASVYQAKSRILRRIRRRMSELP